MAEWSESTECSEARTRVRAMSRAMTVPVMPILRAVLTRTLLKEGLCSLEDVVACVMAEDVKRDGGWVV
jgi:hypothetical protein